MLHDVQHRDLVHRMTANEIRRRFPKASEAFIKANAQADNPPQGSESERAVRNEPVATAQRENSNSTRIALRIVSYRRRIIDPDNCIPKYFIDGLRYAALIPGDRADQITFSVEQIKVKTKEEERTEIEISSISTT